MARIAGVNLPPNKRAEIGLTYIFGIGRNLSVKILKEANIDISKKIKDLGDMEVEKLKEIIEKNYKVEGELKREVLMNIKRLKEINCYRGIRHAKHLPVRGQRTKTNTRTVRGNVRRTMGSGRKKSAEKT
ncbi:MAG: small subunit ribosomal protein S13 [Parcubacteria group bacterium Athens1014_10]|nr:MAG: small subunit ribosomal protein S13 [Parcubacteria group bacterium Athens1014_10]TSD06059.1 MAG: small subunit ribosomal protein S13 [Parcubacteria group bacterium Athens0714_12]